MATTIPEVKATKREKLGTVSTQLGRDEGTCPAVLYGHKKDNVNLALNTHDFEVLLRDHPTLVKLDIGGEQEHAIIKDLQYDYVGPKLLHVDFLRVSLDEIVKVNTALEFFGTPAGSEQGGKLEVVRTEVAIAARADNIPKNIVINVSALKLGDAVRCSDIELPEGAELVSHPESFVARCEMPRRAKAAANAATAATEAAEGDAGAGASAEPAAKA